MQITQIRYLRRELEEYRLLAEAIPEGCSWRVQAFRQKQQNAAERLAAELWEISKFISEIDDSELRLIFQLRYFQGYPWARVAEELPTTLSADGARMKHDRYLKKISIGQKGGRNRLILAP